MQDQIKEIKPQKLTIECQDKLPVIIQIAHQEFMIKPQYPDTQIRLIQILIRINHPQIPQSEQLHLNNWTKGRQIGKNIQKNQTLSSLLIQSNQKIPKIRVYWQNCKSFVVDVDVHDILIFTYTQMNQFHYIDDLFKAINKDIKKKFKLKSDTLIKLKGIGILAKKSKLSYVGRCLDVTKQNKVQVLVCFEEYLSISFVKQQNGGKYEHLICPISLNIMQQPVITSCKHIFDKLWISLNIVKIRICPICRLQLGLSELKPVKKFQQQINKLKRLQLQQKAEVKKQEQQQPE